MASLPRGYFSGKKRRTNKNLHDNVFFSRKTLMIIELYVEILLNGLQGRSFSENSLHREIHQQVGTRGTGGLSSAKMSTTRGWRDNFC